MYRNESKLIKRSGNSRCLTAAGYNLMHRMQVEACRKNGFEPFGSDAARIKSRVKTLFFSLAFEHGKSYEEISEYFKQIKRI